MPHLNFEAMAYGEMIHWERTDVSIIVIPVVRNISNEEIIKKLSLPENTSPEYSFAVYLCHTVAVERTVTLVSIAATHVCGNKARDGVVRSTLISLQVLPKFKSKSQFLAIFPDGDDSDSGGGGAQDAATYTWWALGHLASFSG